MSAAWRRRTETAAWSQEVGAVFGVSQRAGGGRLVLCRSLQPSGWLGSPPRHWPSRPRRARRAPSTRGRRPTSTASAPPTSSPSNAWFTLRAASLTRGLLPRPRARRASAGSSSPSPTGTFLDRETVDDDPRHIEPVAPGVTARVEPLAGLAGVPPGDRDRALAADQDLDHRSGASDGARPDPLRVAHRRGRCSSTCSPTRRRATTATTTAARAAGQQLVASDDAGATVVAASRGWRRRRSGYRGTRERPVGGPGGRQASLSEYDATEPGNVVQGARAGAQRAARQPDDDAGDRLRAGRRRRAARRPTGSLAGGFAARGGELRRRLGPLPRLAQGRRPPAWRATPACGASTSSRCSCWRPPRTRPTAARRSPRRTCRGSGARSRSSRTAAASRAPTTSSGRATSTTSPPRRRPPATTPPPARLLDYLWSVQKADGSFWQNTRVDGTPKWTTEQLDQTSLPIVLAWWLGRTGAADWAHVEQAADYIVANGPASDNERWENQSGYSPNTIATEIAGLICAADIARSQRRAAARRGSTRRWPTTGSATSRPGPRRTTGPTRPSRTTCA